MPEIDNPVMSRRLFLRVSVGTAAVALFGPSLARAASSETNIEQAGEFEVLRRAIKENVNTQADPFFFNTLLERIEQPDDFLYVIDEPGTLQFYYHPDGRPNNNSSRVAYIWRRRTNQDSNGSHFSVDTRLTMLQIGPEGGLSEPIDRPVNFTQEEIEEYLEKFFRIPEDLARIEWDRRTYVDSVFKNTSGKFRLTEITGNVYGLLMLKQVSSLPLDSFYQPGIANPAA